MEVKDERILQILRQIKKILVLRKIFENFENYFFLIYVVNEIYSSRELWRGQQVAPISVVLHPNPVWL